MNTGVVEGTIVMHGNDAEGDCNNDGSDLAAEMCGVGVGEISEESVPSGTFSFSVHPNPADHTVTITVEIVEPNLLRSAVIDLLGRKVQTIAGGLYYPGRHAVTVDASSLPAGVYFVRLRAGDRVVTRSLVVAR